MDDAKAIYRKLEVARDRHELASILGDKKRMAELKELQYKLFDAWVAQRAIERWNKQAQRQGIRPTLHKTF